MGVEDRIRQSKKGIRQKIMCRYWESVVMNKSMICTQLDCGCVTSCDQLGGLVVGCNGLECDFIEWKHDHSFCNKCGYCIFCGKCQCPERFGV